MKKWFVISICACFFTSHVYAPPTGDHAHPCNFRQTHVSSWGGILSFTYAWDSTSGNLADLSHVEVGEWVTYSDGGIHKGADRPWNKNDPDPTQHWWAPGTDGGVVDTHYANSPDAGPADSYTATQYYGFKCQICGATFNLHGFTEDLLGPITISRYVEQLNDSSWQYRINKSGSQGVMPLP